MKLNYDTLTVPFKETRIISIASSIVKEILAPSSLSRFPVKLICSIDFGGASNFCYLLKSTAINL